MSSRAAFGVNYKCSLSSRTQSIGHKSDLQPALLGLFGMVRVLKVLLLSLGGEPYFGIVPALLCHRLNELLTSLGILNKSMLGAESTSMLTWPPIGVLIFLLLWVGKQLFQALLQSASPGKYLDSTPPTLCTSC